MARHGMAGLGRARHGVWRGMSWHVVPQLLGAMPGHAMPCHAMPCRHAMPQTMLHQCMGP